MSKKKETIPDKIDALYDKPMYSLYSFTPSEDILTGLKHDIQLIKHPDESKRLNPNTLIDRNIDKIQISCMEPIWISLYDFDFNQLRYMVPNVLYEKVISKLRGNSNVESKQKTYFEFIDPMEILIMIMILKLKRDKYWGAAYNKLFQCPTGSMMYKEHHDELHYSLYVMNEFYELVSDTDASEFKKLLHYNFNSWQSNCPSIFEERQFIHAATKQPYDKSLNLGVISARWQIPANISQTFQESKMYVKYDPDKYTNTRIISELNTENLYAKKDTIHLHILNTVEKESIDVSHDIDDKIGKLNVSISVGPYFSKVTKTENLNNDIKRLNDKKINDYQSNYFDEIHHVSNENEYEIDDYKRRLYIGEMFQQWCRDLQTIKIFDSDDYLSVNYDWLYIRSMASMEQIINRIGPMIPQKVYTHFPIIKSDIRIGFFNFLGKMFQLLYFSEKKDSVKIISPYIMKYIDINDIEKMFNEWLQLEFEYHPSNDKSKIYATTEFRRLIAQKIIPYSLSRIKPVNAKPILSLSLHILRHLNHISYIPMDKIMPFINRYYYHLPVSDDDIRLFPLIKVMLDNHNVQIDDSGAFHYLSQQMGYINNILYSVVVHKKPIRHIQHDHYNIHKTKSSGGKPGKKSETTSDVIEEMFETEMFMEDILFGETRTLTVIEKTEPEPEELEKFESGDSPTSPKNDFVLIDITPESAGNFEPAIPEFPGESELPIPEFPVPEKPHSPEIEKVEHIIPDILKSPTKAKIITEPLKSSPLKTTMPQPTIELTEEETESSEEESEEESRILELIDVLEETYPSEIYHHLLPPEEIETSQKDHNYPTIHYKDLKDYMTFQDNYVAIQLSELPLGDYDLYVVIDYEVKLVDNIKSAEIKTYKFTQTYSSSDPQTLLKIRYIPEDVHSIISGIYENKHEETTSITYFIILYIQFQVLDLTNIPSETMVNNVTFFKRMVDFVSTSLHPDDVHIIYDQKTHHRINLPWRYIRNIHQTINW